MFTSIFGEISEDPLRGITNLHKRSPAAVFLQEKYEIVSWVARLTMSTSESTMLEKPLEV